MPAVTGELETTATRSPRITRARAIVAAAVIAVASSAATAVFWWRSHEPPREALAPAWPAVVQAIAGDGVVGYRDGAGDRARFAEPYGIAAGADGLVYVADGAGGDRVRVVSQGGEVATLAGGPPGFADGTGIEARFSTPSGLAVGGDGLLYVADTGNHAIRRVAPDGRTTTIAGGRAPGFVEGTAHEAHFNAPIGIAVDPRGRVVVADTYNDRIRAISPEGAVTTLAGATRGFADGRAADAQFDTPCGVALGPDGTVYVADTGNDRVRAIAPDGAVTTIADPSHGLYRPLGITAAPTGELYITDEAGHLFERTPDGAVRVVAGSTIGYRDGPGADARFRRPAGVAWIAAGRLVVADAGNALVRLVEAKALARLRPPAAPTIAPRFETAALGGRPLLWPVEPQYGPFEVAGTMGEARGEAAYRFHAGVDVRAEQGLAVLAVRDGVIQLPLAVSDFGTLNESLRIGPIGYVHVRAGRDRRGEVDDEARFAATRDAGGRVVAIRAKRGARFRTGDAVATINAFNHVHLNVGWPGEEHNPLMVGLVQFQDAIPPTIAAGGVRLFGSNGEPITRRVNRRLVLSGDVRIVVDAWDRADGNRADRRLGLYELGYQVFGTDGQPAPGFAQPRITLRFDRLSREADAPRLVYAPGSGIPFYGERRTRFLYNITNTFRHGQAAEGAWHTSALPPGDYLLRIIARDAAGNTALAHRDLPVTIEPSS